MEEAVLRRAIRHLAMLGDTDILPPLFEFVFYDQAADSIVKRLTALNYSNYQPVGAFEVLSPKSITSFRIAHQLYATDSLLYTAAALSIAPSINDRRLSSDDGAFSYRFHQGEELDSIFDKDCSFHSWLIKVTEMCEMEKIFESEKYVLETDISDFYSRIYFHRVEHLLDDIGAPNSVRRVIENIIKTSRARQSYGLPVGSAASRIIAEGFMIDIDNMLVSEGLKFSRYVDDFRIFVDDQATAHSALCRLAEYLMLAEGLSLNASKTKIQTRSKIVEDIESKFSDVFSDNERKALDKYIQAIYDGEDIEEAVAEDVDPEILVDKLGHLIADDTIDYGSAKLILKALRSTGVANPVDFVYKFQSLLYFAPRDFCILVGALAQKNPESVDEIRGILVDISHTIPFSEMALARIWINHLFVAGAFKIDKEIYSKIQFRDTVIERRQRILLRGLLGDRAYFREAKTKFADLSDWEKPAIMFAASCLSRSEYETWLQFCKGRFNDILSEEYIVWLRNNRENLFSFLTIDFTLKNRVQRIAEMFKGLAPDSAFFGFVDMSTDAPPSS